MILDRWSFQFASQFHYHYKDSLLGCVMHTPNLKIWTHRLWCPDFMVLRQCMLFGWHTPTGVNMPWLAQAAIWDYVGPPTTVWFFSALSCTLGNLDMIYPEKKFRVMVIPTLGERMSISILTECILYRREDLFTTNGLIDFLFKVQKIAEREGNMVRCKFTHYTGAMLVTWVPRAALEITEDQIEITED